MNDRLIIAPPYGTDDIMVPGSGDMFTCEIFGVSVWIRLPLCGKVNYTDHTPKYAIFRVVEFIKKAFDDLVSMKI